MIFYGYFRSSAAYRCRIAFNLLRIKPEERYVHLVRDGGEQRKAEYAKLNPQKLVPILQVDDAIISQSLAIIEYVNETHNGNLLGNDALLRAKIRAFSQIIACDIHPLQNLRVLQYIAAEFGQTEQAQKDKWCQKWLGDGLAACEEIAIQQTHGGRFTFGDQPSLADICLVPQIFSAQRFNVDLSTMPRLRTIFDNCQEMGEFALAAPAQQPDAE